jgi:transposase InsO family protein
VVGKQTGSIGLQARTVHRILDRNGLIESRDRRPHALNRFERREPNELWQMDFKGPQGFNRGSAVGPLSIMDDHSRYLLLLQHLGSTSLEGVRTSLRKTFREAGMPDSMLMDHGTPWWNAASPWGLTELSVWIMRLGIRLIYSGICHPQTQGKVERMHGALQQAIRKRKANPEHQPWLDAFRDEYNHVRPHEALQMATPASFWKPSARNFPEHLKDWEYAPTCQCLRLGGQGQLWWAKRRWEISNALRGQLVGVEQILDRAIVYFCRTPIRELDLKSGVATPIIGMPMRSLRTEEERPNTLPWAAGTAPLRAHQQDQLRDPAKPPRSNVF